MRVVRLLFVAIGGILALAAGPERAMALDGKAIVGEKCVSCHNMTGPAPAATQDPTDLVGGLEAFPQTHWLAAITGSPE